MESEVFFLPMSSEEKLNAIHDKIYRIYEAAAFDACVEKNDLVAIKIHFGEKGNTTHIPATYILPISENIKKNGGQPFLTDTNVLYRSHRSDAISHLKLAQGHGFTLNNCGAAVIIADGLRGSNEVEVQIHGKIFDTVSIATEAVHANALFALTHVTGHMATGLGGALKNLGMGLASRKGKLRQHSSVKPWVEQSACTGCGLCIQWCPADAIVMTSSDVASIQHEICIGCGECLTVCRYHAVKYNWETSNADLQMKIAEHALGAVKNKHNKTAYINFLINITKDCDCIGSAQEPLMPDIGILASKDPVAIDQASLDIIQHRSGNSLRALSYPDIDETIQLQHAVSIGLGNRKYELVELS